MAKTLNSHSACLHPGEYKWVPANYQGNLTKCWGGGGEVTFDGLVFNARESSNTLCRFILWRLDEVQKFGPVLASLQTGFAFYKLRESIKCLIFLIMS